MKKYPAAISSDQKGQLVIPKSLRRELSIDEGDAFWAFAMENEGILLKRVIGVSLSQHDLTIVELKENSEKLAISKSNIDRSVERYRKKKSTALEEI